MIIKIKVKTNSKKQEIKEENGIYIIRLKSPPENNKANIELIKLLTKYFNKFLKIKSGFTSRNKTIELQ